MLDQIMQNTIEYLLHFSKTQRKEYGQFFTGISTARYMASLVEPGRSKVRILDAGCGNGMLAAAVVEHLLKNDVREVELDLFETDQNIIPLLNKNLKMISDACREAGAVLRVKVYIENFILYYQEVWKNKGYQGKYDVVISNPPYLKIGKKAEESAAMDDIVYGQPNIYALFMAMSCHLLKKEGQFVFITPRSWTSGLYFKRFRKYLLDNLSIKRMHLFVSREKVFGMESVLQETMILYGEKTELQQREICIAICNDAEDYGNLRILNVKASVCLPGPENYYVLIPADQEDIAALKFLSEMENEPRKSGYLFKTGQVVEFRNRDNLRYSREKHTIPLIQACNLVQGSIKMGVETDKAQYFLLDKKHEKMCMENQNTVMLKRFTSKEETRRLQAAVHLKVFWPEEKYITAENHVNYLIKINGNLSQCETYGFYVILSSSIWDRYYRILNGSTQVNSEELNTMPIPDQSSIQRLGRIAIRFLKEQKTIDSDEIVRSVFV